MGICLKVQGWICFYFIFYFRYSPVLSHSVSAPVTLAPPAAPSFCSLLRLLSAAPSCCSLLLLSSSRSHCLLCSLQASPSPARSGQVLQGLVRPRWAFLGIDRSVHAIMVLSLAGQPEPAPCRPVYQRSWICEEFIRHSKIVLVLSSFY